MISDEDFIPPLSGRLLDSFTPSEFKAYVRSLYRKRTPKKSAPKRKRLREFKITARVTKKGKITLTTKREPKYITEEELRSIAATLSRGENEVFIVAKEKEIAVLRDHEEAERIRAAVEEIPW